MNVSRFLSVSLIIVNLLYLSSCHYLPFVKYFNQNKETQLPNFSKKSQLVGAQNNLRLAYDVTLYDWYVKPNPADQSISGKMIIEFVGKLEETTILLDLQKKLKIDDLISDYPLSYFKRKGDLLYITFQSPLVVGKKVSLDIQYHGKPIVVAKEGPIQWKVDKHGYPWISTQTEGIGAHFMMPCKLPLYDEPEKCFIRVEVDKNLSVVANGKLDSITQKEDTQIFHHSVLNPINIYNISFNIGDFEKLEKDYTDINGVDRKIQIFPLKQDRDTADLFYNDISMILGHCENLFGPFPWWRDGCKFVQSTLGSSAMEHQSAISMGSIYYHDYIPADKIHINTTVIHELAHEWWGNLITAEDYCDIWIHEGMATYAELLVIERIYGKRYYDWSANKLARYINNERPVIKSCDVLYNSWVSSKDQNIYYKGAILMHTLRSQVQNDILFLKSIKKSTEKFRLQNITSEQFESFFNKELGQDFSWLFDMYLRNTAIPELGYKYDSLNNNLEFKWISNIKNQDKIILLAQEENDELIPLYPKSTFQKIKLIKGENPVFSISNTGYITFTDLGENQ
ncbi:MAG: aminopeptidase N [Cyclobacteriaceae bacterium]|jgi:aminopeptidase N